MTAQSHPQFLLRLTKISKEAFSIDSRTLSMFRIALGVLCLWRVLYLWPYIGDFFGPDGFMPPVVLNEWGSRWSFFFLNHTVWWAYIHIFIMGVLSICMIIGYKTKYAVPVLWLLFVSLSNRAHPIENGGHAAFRMAMFWVMFLPLNVHWTYKQWWQKKAAVEPYKISNIATAGFILQFIMIYFFAGVTKDDPAWVSKFDAVYKTLHVGPFVKPAGYWLAQFHGLTKFLTAATLFLEIVVPWFLLAPKWRTQFAWVAILLLVSLQIGFRTCFMLGAFPFIMMIWTLAFIPTSFWEYVEKRKKKTVQATTFIVETKTIQWKILQAIALCTILLSWWNNMHNTYKDSIWKMPVFIEETVNLFRIDQRWWMFTHEQWFDYWLDTEGIDAAGNTIVDPWAWYRGDKDIRFSTDRPDSVVDTFVTQLWNRYMHDVKDKKLTGQWFLYNMCKKYNAAHPNEKIKTIKLYESAQRIDSFTEMSPITVKVLNEWDCDK